MVENRVVTPDDAGSSPVLHPKKNQLIGGVMTFLKEITDIINKYSMETESNTPDFVLAGYLDNCLEIFNLAVEARDKFYGEDHTCLLKTTTRR